jgi:type II restriction enzyme
LQDWSRVIFIRNNSAPESRGWLLETMKCIDRIGKETFGLDEVYALAPRMSVRFPNNKHVKPKLRQQLQILRDAGFLTFLGGGRYRLSATSA